MLLLLEFQSREDPWMAVHILPCTALLWQNLIKTGAVSEKEDLSPSFPLVIYSRSKPWNAAQDVADLLAPQAGRLLAYQPINDIFSLTRVGFPKRPCMGAIFPYSLMCGIGPLYRCHFRKRSPKPLLAYFRSLCLMLPL